MNISKPLPYTPTQSTETRPDQPTLCAPCSTFDPPSGAKKPTVRFNIEAVQDEDPLQEWNTKPHTLRQTTLLSVLVKIGDLVLILCPVFFLVLCILASSLHEQPTQNNVLGQHVETIMSLGPTIFPILFSAIAGRTVKSLAHYLAGKGEALGTLEVLMASQSTWGTFESQLLLRKLTLIGAHLMVMWALSPIGGQASLRLLSKSSGLIIKGSQVRYLDTGNGKATQMSAFNSRTSGINISICNSAYTATLISPAHYLQGPQDLWGNPRIPRLEMLNPSAADPDGWIKVPDTAPQDFYTSLIGVPIVGLSNQTTSLSIEASYMSLQCGAAQNLSLLDSSWKHQLGQIWGKGGVAEEYGNPDPFNASLGSYSGIAGFRSFFLDTSLDVMNQARRDAAFDMPLNTTELQDPLLQMTRNIIFGSQLTNLYGPRLMLINCTVTQSHVEANTTCGSGRCAVTKLRKSTNNTRRGNITPLDDYTLLTAMFGLFPVAAGYVQNQQSSPTEYYIKDSSSSPFRAAGQEYAYTDLMTITPKDVGLRLATVLNTYYQVSLAPTGFFGGLPTNLSLYGPPVIRTIPDAARAPMISRQTPAILSDEFEKYVCNYAWLGILCAAASLLLLWGLLGMSLRLCTKVPEMFGYVASMTYHNQYLNLPRGGPLDGIERAQALKDLRVKVVDVRPDEDVGEIALVSENILDQEKGQKKPRCGTLRNSKLYL